MKKAVMILTLMLLCIGVKAQNADEPLFKPVQYEGFELLVPAEAEMHDTGKSAIVKCPDGTFGLSLQVTKDKKAGTEAAVQLCRRMVTDLKISGATLSRVTMHGLSGARVRGTAEGAPITVLVLDGGKRFFQAVAINTPRREAWVDRCLESIAKVK